ncbi:MAG: DUF1822 family protein [Richelia sp. RM2_1_2]|nr:DUF1822 family protein [Richelia sp. SM1_7_0]NJN11792.1 DUF1822 family protein [Richelia sp. RM1_1_1]NJO29447.1 DUF1822 family protein [Richelia sp. SL_2_1]NJO62752.1 DUF1822 family protein [Richelia sp. RM2_1_2]
MSLTIISQELNFFEIPIGIKARKKAQEIASQQIDIEIAKKKYLSTLSWYVVFTYLKMLDINVNPEESYCWNPVFYLNPRRNITDIFVSDLEERLEVFPVLPDANFVSFPDEVIENRLAYVCVQLNKGLTTGIIRGHTYPKEGIIALDKLTPFTELLSPANNAMCASTSSATVSSASSTTVNTEIPPEFKFIDLGESIGTVKLTATRKLGSPKNDISVVAQSDDNQPLPPGVELALVNKEGKPIISHSSSKEEKHLQLSFSRTPGKPYLIRLAFNNKEVIEQFSN